MSGEVANVISKRDIRLYHWKYDDGCIQYVLIGKTPKDLMKRGICQDRQDFKDRKREIEKKLGDGNNFTSQKLKIPCGLTAFGKDDVKSFSLEQDKHGFAELLKLLDCCGKTIEGRRTVMELVSGIFAGYCARLIYQNDQDDHFNLLSQRAPVIQISGDDQTFDVLTQIVCALAVDTSAFDKKLQLENPQILPPQITAFSIDQCAYLTFRKKPHRYAAQYRDTAVLVHGFFFKKSDIIAFVRRNRWASMILFKSGGKEWGASTVLLSGKVLREAELSWDVRAIHELIRDYLHWLSKYDEKEGREDFTDIMIRQMSYVEKDLYRYVLHSKKKLSHSQQGVAMLQLLALRFFLHFCAKKRIVTREEELRLLTDWEERLLPGCRQGTVRESKPPEPHETPIDQLQELLSNMIRQENKERFLFVGDGDTFDRKNPDIPDFCYWGYCRIYKEKSGKYHPVLQIRRRDFEETAEHMVPPDQHVRELFSKLDRENPPYLLIKKARFHDGIGTSNSEDAYVFDISKMSFLTAEQRALLMSRFPPDSIKHIK